MSMAMDETREATARPWELSDAIGGEGEHLVVAGEGHDFGLVAAFTYRRDAQDAVTAVNERDSLLSRIASLEAEKERLREVLERHVAAFKPFTSKPIGAPNSYARLQQEDQVAAHEQARSALNEGSQP